MITTHGNTQPVSRITCVLKIMRRSGWGMRVSKRMLHPVGGSMPRPGFQIGDKVGAVFRIRHRISHFLSRYQFFGIGQPFIQISFNPDQLRFFQRRAIFEIGDAARLSSVHTAVRRLGKADVDGVAGYAAG